jgi:hypothetical protein
MSAFDEVEGLDENHFWALVAAFACAALLHAYFDRLLPDDALSALVYMLVSGSIGYWCGRILARRGGQFAIGFILGLVFFGVFAIPIVMWAPVRVPRPGTGKKSCERCFTSVRRESSMCPACGLELTPWTFEQRRWWREQNGTKQWWDEKRRRWVDQLLPSNNVVPTPPPPVAVLPDLENDRRP